MNDDLLADLKEWAESYDAVEVGADGVLYAAINRIEALKQVRDDAYRERNTLVAFLSHFYPAGMKATQIAGWDEAWHNCVYIDLPTGQASWHVHINDMHLFNHLGAYDGDWDGHSNEDKYERLARAALGEKKNG